ncbi:MAG: tetratricopeptide repeat protein [Planctomycetota bacterium]
MIIEKFGEDRSSTADSSWLRRPVPEDSASVQERLLQLSRQLKNDSRFPATSLVAGDTPGSQILEKGMTLERCILRICPDPEAGWEVLVPGGLRTLVGYFANFARLLAVLNEEGISIVALRPEAVVLRDEGGLQLLSDRSIPDLVEQLDEVANRLAPEILLSPEKVASDECQIVYTLAVLIHECAFGRPPWTGRGATEVADRILSGSFVVERSDIVQDPPGLRGLLEDALSLEPQRRPASLRGFASMLDAVRDGARPRAQRRRSATRSVRGERRWQRVAAAMSLMLFAGFLGRFSVSEPLLEDLIKDLSSAMLARPLPVHAEDSPVDSLGRTLFDLHGESVKVHHESVELQREMAWVALRAGQWKEARRAARFAAQSDPSRPGPWVILGITALEQGDLAGRLELERGLELIPQDLFDRWSIAAGQFYLLRFSDAVETLDGISELTPEDADVWFHHALASLRSGDPVGASQSLARSRQMRPFDGWIDWLLAEVALAEGREDEARRILEEATSRFSSSKALALRAGSLWDRLGDSSRSREWIRRSDSDRLDSPHREWRTGGRIVEEDRSLLFLGPPFPPKEQ